MEAKLGIYAHWGLYSVPACGPNVSWYGYNMYREGSAQHAWHCRTYGDPRIFGYKDFIPLFTAPEFDADEWAGIFASSGARFAGPVAEHHDGFSMWRSACNPWNAAAMGPRRDIVGELAAAIRARGMRFMVAMHHAENWWFYPHWKLGYDTADPSYAGLYGEAHNQDWSGRELPLDSDPDDTNHWAFWPTQERPSRAFLDGWLAKLKEVEDLYRPDLLWLDFGIDFIQEHYLREWVSYFYNRGFARGQEKVLTYKWHHLAPGCGVEDIEQGRREDLAHNVWLTDTTVDSGEAWAYMRGNSYKSPAAVIHYLIDNVSKNGALLLNVGPEPGGRIPAEAAAILRELGEWLAVNGEAIYGTAAWMEFGEGPHRILQAGAMSEGRPPAFDHRDFRFTVKDDDLFIHCLGQPKDEIRVRTPAVRLYPGEIESIRLLGCDKLLPWRLLDGHLAIQVPVELPCRHAVVFKLHRRHPFGGASVGKTGGIG